jgi:hypothetical protein
VTATMQFCVVLAVLCGLAGVIEHFFYRSTAPPYPYRTSIFWPALGILILMIGHAVVGKL